MWIFFPFTFFLWIYFHFFILVQTRALFQLRQHCQLSIQRACRSWEFHAQRSLVGYSPWDFKELDMTEQLILSLSLSLSASPKWDKQSTHILLPTVCVRVCIYTIVLKRQMASVYVELELMKQRVRSHLARSVLRSGRKPRESRLGMSTSADTKPVTPYCESSISNKLECTFLLTCSHLEYMMLLAL